MDYTYLTFVIPNCKKWKFCIFSFYHGLAMLIGFERVHCKCFDKLFYLHSRAQIYSIFKISWSRLCCFLLNLTKWNNHKIGLHKWKILRQKVNENKNSALKRWMKISIKPYQDFVGNCVTYLCSSLCKTSSFHSEFCTTH